METPNRVKVNILALLLTHGVKRGIALDRLASYYEEDIQEPLDFKAWGFSFLMEFFQAMPDLFRLKYERREESWKVYPRVKRNPLLTRNIHHFAETERTIVLPGKLHQQSKDTFAAFETASEDSVEGDTRPVDVNQLSLVPDQRGLYSVCFSTERKPEEWKDLKGIFSMAGPVVEIHQTAKALRFTMGEIFAYATVLSEDKFGVELYPATRWGSSRFGKMTFVRYASADELRLALKLFPLLGLLVARVNIDVRQAGQVKRRNPVATDESSVEVLVRNLHTHCTVTEVHLQELFHGFDLLHVDVHYDSSLCSQFAEVRLATMSEAQRLISLFDGHNFLGRSLVISIKSPKRASLSQKENFPLQTRTVNYGPSQKCSTPEDRQKDMPRPKSHSDSEMFTSDLKKEDDIYMESMCLEQVSDCKIEEEVEESACEHRSVFRQVYEKSALPGGRELTVKVYQGLASEHEASSKRREDASWGNSRLRYGFDKQMPDFRESSGMEHFYTEQWTTTAMSHNGRGGQTENIHKEWTPNKTLLGSGGFSSRQLQQGHNRETPHGKGQSSFQESIHQRQGSSMTKGSQDKQESLFSKSTPRRRMFDTDLELEERVYHDTNPPSSSGYRDNSQGGRHHLTTDLQGFEPAPTRREGVYSNTSRSGLVSSKESARKEETSVAQQKPVLNESFETKASSERGRRNQSERSDVDLWYEKDTLHKEEDSFSERSHLRSKGSVQEGGAEHRSVINSPQMSALEVRVKQTGVEVPCIFVTNFQKWTTEKHLSRWFANYNPISVCLVQCASTGMRKAHMELSDVEMVRQAVYEMNQKKICEMKIKVDVPFFLPKLRAEVLGTNPVSLKRMKNPKLSPFIGDQGMLEELAQHGRTVTEELGNLDLSLSSGAEVEVMVTNVISDSLFMGQVHLGDVVWRLEEISKKISVMAESLSSPCQEERLQFHGACLAKWKMDYQWHRGWLLGGHAHDKAAQVYLLDVGVLDFVAWSCVRGYDNPAVWDLPPVALPFSLSEPIVQLKYRLRSQITVAVTDTDKDGIIAARPVSLISNWKEMLNIDTVLF